MKFGGSINEEESFAIMRRAVDGAINFFDTANVYNRTGDGPNDWGGSRYHIIKACEESPQRLQTDHIDLNQLHCPPMTHSQKETLRAWDDLIHARKVR